MKDIAIHLNETANITRKDELISFGVPFKKGELTNLDALSLIDINKSPVNFDCLITARWDDGSVKWISIRVLVSLEKKQQTTFFLMPKSGRPANVQALDLQQQDHNISISVNASRLRVSSSLAGFDVDGQTFSIIAKAADGASLVAQVDTNELELGSRQCYARLCQKGRLILPGKQRFLYYQLHLCYFVNASSFSVDLTIHNPFAAEHKDGLWDLGDPNSIHIKSLVLCFDGHVTTLIGEDNEKTEIAKFQSLMLHQYSSGGECWDSPNHVEADAKVHLAKKGYRLTLDGKSITGDRISPVFISKNKQQTLSFSLAHFWQNFPSSVSSHNGGIALALFPGNESTTYEIQGGEAKTHRLLFDMTGAVSVHTGLETPINCRLERNYLCYCAVLPYLDNEKEDTPYRKLMRHVVEGDNTFCAKRETIDEYGWRNFGDLYADHERYGYSGDDIFVSHYNNQYDSLYGLLRQHLISGDERWSAVYRPLALHIFDIDIYKTQGDRAEYNGGLLWHTDHYLKAYTCTHRTYSREHVNQSHVFGGGPCGEHCYTNGFKYFYFLYGEPFAKQAVLTMTQWITGFYEGSQTLAEKIYYFKSLGLAQLKQILTHRVLIYRYPLDRGVGNYIRALLDSYELTDDSSFIERAEYVMTNTIHYDDDISLRDFDNIEETWFYTIFLQAIIDYIQLCERLDVQRHYYSFAIKVLIHYARWMMLHERPTLEWAEKLDYPNDAWTAQDIRKAHILFVASQYHATQSNALLEKARYFRDYVVSKLECSEELSFTRTQCLLMQNDGPSAFIVSADADHQHPIAWPDKQFPNKRLTAGNIIVDFISTVFRRLVKLSVDDELHWLSFRVGKLRKYRKVIPDLRTKL